MKLTAERLRAQLDKGLGPLYVLAGDEPLLVDEALALIRERAERDCGERESRIAERSFDWDEFAAGLRNLSLFSSRRLVELRLPTGKPGDAGARFLTELASKPDTGNVIVLLLPGLDSQTAKSRWASSLAEAGAWVELRPPSREELPAWLARRLRAARLTADEETLDLLASRVEGNLLAAKQEIDKLALLVEDGRVTIEAIRDSVADDARFDVFQLSEAALSGDPERTVRVLQGLKREGEAEALVLWSLARDVLTLADVATRVAEGRSIDQALEGAGVWRSRQGAFRAAAAQNRGLKAIGRLVRSTARADQIVKGVRKGDPWNALLEVSLGLSGGQPTLAETG